MEKKFWSVAVLSLIAIFGASGVAVNNIYAEDVDKTSESSENSESGTSESGTTSLTLSPVSETLDISSNSSYEKSLKIKNEGSSEVKIKVYAAPYSYVYSEQEDLYKLGYSHENDFTQISRWIRIADADGKYVENPTFKLGAGEEREIFYKIKTPDNIPAGGQYAVIFAQTVASDSNDGGIKTEASTGMVIYGRSTEGDLVVSPEIHDLEIGQGLQIGAQKAENNDFYGKAKVKNNGNVDFYARGVLKVEPIIGVASYETSGNKGSVSVIPESEQIVKDVWEGSPDVGIYKVTWTVTAGEDTQTVEKIVFLITPLVAILFILVLTGIIVGVIIFIKKRKERRSRLAI